MHQLQLPLREQLVPQVIQVHHLVQLLKPSVLDEATANASLIVVRLITRINDLGQPARLWALHHPIYLIYLRLHPAKCLLSTPQPNDLNGNVECLRQHTQRVVNGSQEQHILQLLRV